MNPTLNIIKAENPVKLIQGELLMGEYTKTSLELKTRQYYLTQKINNHLKENDSNFAILVEIKKI